jgi:DNA invertase Pin-like site-specific DNA recombinase
MLIGYMRVSTDGERQTLDLQHDALTAAGVDDRHIFRDKMSGSRDDRPGLAAALEYARPGDCLVVWKLDRLGRSLPHLLDTVGELQKRGIAFRSLTEQMDTSTAQGAFLFQIFGALAQFERSLIRERVLAGLDAARRRGRVGGRKSTISQDTIAGARMAVQAGESVAAISLRLGVPRSTLSEALARHSPPLGDIGIPDGA